jgi:heat shock protein HslJ
MKGSPLVLLLVALLLAACARGPAAGPGDTAPDGSGPGVPVTGSGGTPAGRAFVVTAVTVAGAPKQVVAGTRIEVRFFHPPRLGVSAGCNSIGGPVRFDGGRLVVTELATTEIGCAPERQAQDEWLMQFLEAKPAWRLSGDELVLTAGDTELRLVDRSVAVPDRSVAGTVWKVDGLQTGDTTSSVPAGVQAQLTFTADGAVTGSTGCNSLQGRASIAGDRITVTGVATTKKRCETAANEVEVAVLRVLGQPMSYDVDGNRLTLTAPDGWGLQLAA